MCIYWISGVCTQNVEGVGGGKREQEEKGQRSKVAKPIVRKK